MIKEYMNAYELNQYMAVIVMVAFYGIFMFLMWSAFRIKNKDVKKYESIPLDDPNGFSDINLLNKGENSNG